MEIKIGPVLYQVLYVPELASAEHGALCGDFNAAKARIRINADDDPQVQIVTLWHELLHGLLYTAGIREHDEQVIDALAHGLIQLLTENPEIIPIADAAVAQE